ncbi:Asp23/Gls24 family envelope stress response protein [Fodinicola feengrottensis]|uniref:Asp23/Gls24 family envelope stress response protein n=1 Tax=Fodinicola feengrottensis TaxID=435914 RepID=A0ABN2I0X9_9ACTN|nr:Asp23/Gls24 family envelope stress response protein [Fodinicola feengrottensis]
MTAIVEATAQSTVDTRGRLDIDNRVVERIAATAAAQVEAVSTSPPRARIRMADDRATIELQVVVRWPAPLRATARRVREKVAEQVPLLTGFAVAAVHVTVTAMPTTGAAKRRVV